MSDSLYSEINAREYFYIKCPPPDSDIMKLFFAKLSALKNILQRQGAGSLEIILKIDHCYYSFSDTVVTPEFTEILETIDLLDNPERLSEIKILTLTINYNLRETDDTGLNYASPYFTIERFSDRNYYNSIKDYLFYYTYIEDCLEETAGFFSAYGIYNRKEYFGELPFLPLEKMPVCTQWYSPYTNLVCKVKNSTSHNAEEFTEIRKTCSLMDQFGVSVTFHIEDGVLNYSLRQVVIRTSEEASEFCRLVSLLCSKLKGLTSSIEFLELSVNYPLIIQVNINEKGLSFSEKRIDGFSEKL